MYNVTVEFEDMKFRYEDICARWNGYCYDNEILRLANIMPSIEIGEINMTYPIYFDPYTFEVRDLNARKSSETSTRGFFFNIQIIETLTLRCFYYITKTCTIIYLVNCEILY